MEIKAEEITATLKSYEIIDLCDEKKPRVIITLGIGKVASKDSLYGFNFIATYDTTKFKFHTTLTINTLSAFFDIAQVNPVGDGSNELRGVAGDINYGNPPVSGDKDLIAFLGDYIGTECKDTSYIYLEYISFTDEFQNTVTEMIPAEVIIDIEDEGNRYLNLSVSKDTLKFDDIKQNEFIVSMEAGTQKNLETLSLEIIGFDSENYSIEKIESMIEEVEIENIDYGEEKVVIDLKFNNEISSTEILKFGIKELTDKDFSLNIEIEPVKVNECACVLQLEGDKLAIESYEDPVSVVHYSNIKASAYYDVNEDAVIVEGIDETISSLELYDLNGRLVVNRKVIEQRRQKLDLNRFIGGTYILLIKDKKMNIKIIFLIKH